MPVRSCRTRASLSARRGGLAWRSCSDGTRWWSVSPSRSTALAWRAVGRSSYAARAVWARALWSRWHCDLSARRCRARGAVPPDADAAVWWIDDAQRMPPADAERLGSATVATSRVLLLSGRAPLGTSLAAVVRDAVRADPSRVLDVAPLDPQDALAVVAGLSGHGWRAGEEAARALQFAAASGSRVRLLAAVLDAGEGVGGTAVRVAVEDLLSDLTPAARRLLDVVAVGRSAARAAAVQGVWARDAGASSAGFDVALAELLEAGLVVVSSDRLRMGVPIVGDVVAAQLGTGRAAALHVAFAETLARLEGIDPRESADHVRVVADRLPRALSTGVLIAAAERRIGASDPLGAATDLEVAASLLEVAADGGSVADRVAAFDVMLALGTAYFQGGRIEQADATYRRAERFQDAVPPAKVAEFELNKTYVRADRGQPAAFPGEYVDPREGDR